MTKKRLLKAILLCPLFMLIMQHAWAQNKTITGKVSDEKGNPVNGATVIAKGTKIGTSTDATGAFRISVPSSATTLVITYIGYGSQEVSISSASDVTVSLKPEGTVLTDVVVIGYGTARKKDLTGSITSIQAKDFNQGVIAAPDQLLQSKVAGLEVTNTSGQPGAATTIQIRGNSSIRSSNNPLYVVDGVPLDGGTARPNIGTAFGATPNSNPLLFIDPNNIAQIDVLKDAASAAIYGSRGANGVIVITTKKGTSGPMKIDVGANFGVFAGYMKRFEILDAGQFRSALTKYGQPSTLDGGASVDPLKEITQNQLSQNYSVAFSGGNNVGRFRASFLASSLQGFLKNSSLDKYIATFGGNYKFLDNKLTLDFNLIAANYGESLVPVSNTAGSTGSIISSALSWNPTQPFRSANGTYNFPSNGSGNPVAMSDAFSDESNVSEFLGNISAAYKLVNNLEYKFLYGINYGTGVRDLNIEGWLQGFPGLSGLGNASIATAKLASQTFTHTLNYKANIAKDLTMDAVAGYEYFKTDFSGSFVSGSGFNTNLTETNRISIPYTNIMQDAKTQTPYSTFANPTAELQSFFGRVTLNYLDKYILTGSIRADGSSKFGKNNQYGYFPAVSGRWVISNEDFLKDSHTFSTLALRGSYGITGNQEFPAGSSQEQFALTSYNNAPQVVNGNPNLKWESTQSVNLGLDFGFARGRVYGSIDYYNKNTSDILFQTNAIQPAPNSLSFINLSDANLINTGVEFALGATLVAHTDLVWDINLNVAYNKNLVKNFTDPNTGLPLLINTGQINGQGVSGTLAQVITNNQPVNEFYLKEFGGFDATGNQIIGANPVIAGNPNPKVLGGFSTSLTYKKLTLSINMGGAFGFLLYNNTATSVTNIAGIVQGRNIDQAAFNSAEGVGSGVGASTRFLEKGDYFKMRNATLRYNVGNAGKYMKNLTAFVSGSNLFVISKFTGFDPEVNIDKSNNSYPSRSIEYIPYPTPRTITFGFNFSL